MFSGFKKKKKDENVNVGKTSCIKSQDALKPPVPNFWDFLIYAAFLFIVSILQLFHYRCPQAFIHACGSKTNEDIFMLLVGRVACISLFLKAAGQAMSVKWLCCDDYNGDIVRIGHRVVEQIMELGPVPSPSRGVRMSHGRDDGIVGFVLFALWG